MKPSTSRLAIIALGAVLGSAAGSTLSPPPASACDCAPPDWQLRLDPNSSDADRWPQRATLQAYEGTAIVWATDFDSSRISSVHANR